VGGGVACVRREWDRLWPRDMEEKVRCGRSPGRGGLQMSPEDGGGRATHAAPRFVAPMRRLPRLGIGTPRRPPRPTANLFLHAPHSPSLRGAGAQRTEKSCPGVTWERATPDCEARGASPKGEARRHVAPASRARSAMARREDYGGGGRVGITKPYQARRLSKTQPSSSGQSLLSQSSRGSALVRMKAGNSVIGMSRVSVAPPS